MPACTYAQTFASIFLPESTCSFEIVWADGRVSFQCTSLSRRHVLHGYAEHAGLVDGLRWKVADLDSELLQRDAAIDNLQRTLRETQDTLQKAHWEMCTPHRGLRC